MSDFSVRIDFNDILKTLRVSEAEAEKLVGGVALETRNRIVRRVQDRSRSNGPVIRYNPTRTVYPAAEGEAPNTDTGNLVNSVQIEPVGSLTQKILVGAEYGLALELNGHPFVVPAAESIKDDLPRLLEGMAKAIRG
jgi:hypothetical protein